VLGLDERIASLGQGEAFLIVAVVAMLLGLRHATDPDHLTAVSTLVASDQSRRPRRAGALGLSWGAGHATTLFAFGLPVVLFNSFLPETVQRAAEVAIGGVIIALAVRLLLRWRRGYFHAHVHEHDGRRHVHIHMHAHAPGSHSGGHEHDHRHAAALGRSPLQAYGIEGMLALIVFALFTAISMALASTAFGYALSRGPVARRFAALAPALGGLGLGFGVWYALGALQAVPYLF
jgi:hypothetical protein